MHAWLQNVAMNLTRYFSRIILTVTVEWGVAVQLNGPRNIFWHLSAETIHDRSTVPRIRVVATVGQNLKTKHACYFESFRW